MENTRIVSAASPADMTTVSPEIAPTGPNAEIAGGEPGRERVLRVHAGEQRGDDAELVRGQGDDGAALALGGGEHRAGGRRRSRWRRCAAVGVAGIAGPAVAAAVRIGRGRRLGLDRVLAGEIGDDHVEDLRDWSG